MGYAVYPGGTAMSVSPQMMQQLLSLGGLGARYTNQSPLSSGLNNASSALGIYGGLTQGGVGGDLSAGANALRLAGNLTNNPGMVRGGGSLGDVAGIYSGLQEGGVSGYGNAAVDLGRLGENTGLINSSGALGQAIPIVGDALSLYDFGKNWQSGDTGGDALRGGETGATIGSAFGPLGTLIGGAGGALVGAASSAFGGGKHDPETTALQGLIPEYQQAYNENPTATTQALSNLGPQQSFETLAGAMDAKNNTPGHSQPIEQAYGRMQEGSFLNDIAGQINSSYAGTGGDPANGSLKRGQYIVGPDGSIKVGTDQANVFDSYGAADAAKGLYNDVVNPYLTTKTGGQGILGPQNGEGGVLTGAIQNLIGDYMGGALTNTTPIGVSGQADSTLPSYAGMTPQIAANAAAVNARNNAPLSSVQPAELDALRQSTSGGATPLSSIMQQYEPLMQQAQQPNSIAQRPVMAQGGHMKKKLRHFDDGGYVDITSPSDPILNDPMNLFGDSSSGINLNDPFAGAGLPSSYSSSGDSSSALDSLLSQAQTPSGGYIPLPSSSSSSSSGKGLSGSLASLLGSLGLSSGTASTLAQLGLTAASLAPIIASLTGSKTAGNAAQPATTPPAGYAPPSTPFSVPSYSRSYVGPTTSNWSPEQWYKYGEGPEQTFLSNNQLPSMPGLSPAQPAAPAASGSPNMQVAPITGGPGASPVLRSKGGALDQAGMHEGEGYVNDPGYGDGTSDEVNAKLSGGEYVMDGGTVSLLGNGSNDAGARKLDQLRSKVRQHAGRSLVKGKQFMKAKEPTAYLGKGK